MDAPHEKKIKNLLFDLFFIYLGAIQDINKPSFLIDQTSYTR